MELSKCMFNPNITWDIVHANLDKLQHYEYLSFNPNITWDIVTANPNKPWNYHLLSINKMHKHPFYKLSRKLKNTNLTIVTYVKTKL